MDWNCWFLVRSNLRQREDNRCCEHCDRCPLTRSNIDGITQRFFGKLVFNDLKNSVSLYKGNYENPGFVDSPQKSPSVEFDHYGVRRKSIPIISANIELELDHNFYNLLIITFGLFLCGVITGLTWVYSTIWHSEMVN